MPAAAVPAAAAAAGGGMSAGAGMAIGGAMGAAGSIAGGLLSQQGSTGFAYPALGNRARKAYKDPLAALLWNLAKGNGGFGADYMSTALQQIQSQMAGPRAQMQQELGMAQQRRGIFDSGIAGQQFAGLQSQFLTGMGRSMLDVTLKNELQKRSEAMQAMQALLGGIALGTPYNQPGGQTQGGYAMEQGLGAAGDMMQTYAMMKMFNQGGGGGSPSGGGYPMGSSQYNQSMNNATSYSPGTMNM